MPFTPSAKLHKEQFKLALGGMHGSATCLTLSCFSGIRAAIFSVWLS